MIVWCGRCNANPVELPSDPADVLAVQWFGHTFPRPWCRWCLLNVMMLWPKIGVIAVRHPAATVIA